MNDEVKIKIANEIRKRTGKLNLNNQGLKVIPEIIITMDWLRALYIGYNQIQKLENLPRKLTELYIDNNEIQKLENLPQNLAEFNISSNQIQKLQNLPQNLISLFINYNQIQKLENLPQSLTRLGAGNNQIQKLEGLPYNLTLLSVNNNKIQKLENLPQNLNGLDIRSNQITNLAEGWEQISKKGLKISQDIYLSYPDWSGTLSLYNNPFEIPPLEIVRQGHKAVVQYMEQYFEEKGKKDYLFESKLLIIGEPGAGKTTFARRLKNPEALMPKREETTHGINVGKWNFEIKAGTFKRLNHRDALFYVNLWDFGGQAIYHGTHQFFFSEKSLYVLLADTREEKADFGYWLNTIEQLTGENSNLFILLNKRDNRVWQIDENGLKSRFGTILKESKTVDLSNSKAIPNLQNRIKYWLKQLPEIGVPLIESWVRIREDLAKEPTNTISFDHFRTICKKRGVTKSEFINNISRYFTRIGVFTHFIDDPILEGKVYLNSNWLTNSVYELLDNEEAQNKKGRLSLKEIRNIWSDKGLDFEVNKLVALLDKFGLMYRTPRGTFIVPRHLPDQQPYKEWVYNAEQSILHFRYTFDKYMPKGLMSRLIVALHEYIPNHKMVWKRGVNIAHNGAHSEIIERYGGLNQFDIRIAGSFQRDLLVIITQAFDKMLEQYKKLNYNKKIKCPCKECTQLNESYFHNTAEIEMALIKKFNKPNLTVECKRSFEDIPIKDLMALIDYEQVLLKIREISPGPNQNEILRSIEVLGFKLKDGFEKTNRILEDLPCKIKRKFRPELDQIITKLNGVKFTINESERLLEMIEGLINKNLSNFSKAQPIHREWEETMEKAMELTPKGKLELVIPFIPGILTYKTEVATNFEGSHRKKLQQMWDDLKTGKAFRK